MIRNDFVSNSSSSSFLVGFVTREDFDKFKNKILDEWGRDNKFGKLLERYFENNIRDKDNYDEDEDKVKKYEVLFGGIYSSTEDDFETLAPGLLVYDHVWYSDGNEGIQLIYD